MSNMNCLLLKHASRLKHGVDRGKVAPQNVLTVFLSVVFTSVTSPGSTTKDVGEVGLGTISGGGKGLAKINRELRGSMPTTGFLLSKGSCQYDSPDGLVFCTRPPIKMLELVLEQGNGCSHKTSPDGMVGPNDILQLELVFE